ncbi:TPA: oligosaccharide flippase family protein [Streptococcus suis]
MSTETTSSSQKEKMLRGTFWSTVSDFVSRLLGALYIIPWFYWMGQYANEANALFSMGYNIYATILLFSTSGINVALSKQIARYSVLDQEEKIAALINSFLKLMTLSGLFFASLMYFAAPFLSESMGIGRDLVPVLYSLCLSVLVFPAMSTIRGIFQGYANLKPSALSQIFEQLIRVIWMLLTTFFIMKVGDADYKQAVTQSTLAAFIGMIASLLVLFYFLRKENLISLLRKPRKVTADLQVRELVIETFKEAIPFIILGSAIQTYQLIDQFTYINFMTKITDLDLRRLTVLYSYMSANPNKIIMILISIATSIGAVGIPLLTANFLKKDKEAISSLIVNNIKMLNIFIFPALTGSLILANEIYSIFYSKPEQIALDLFVHAILQTFLLAAYNIASPTLLALFESRKAIQYFLIGVLVKLVLQLPFIYLFQSNGPLAATSIATLSSVILMYRHIHQIVGFKQKTIIRHLIKVGLSTLLMALTVMLGKVLLGTILPGTDKFSMLIKLILLGTTGIATYAYLTLKNRLIDDLLGERAEKLRTKLSIK